MPRPNITSAPIMPTHSASAGAFERFDLARVPSPCFVVDEAALKRNLTLLQNIGTAADAKILLALKAFAFFHLAPLVSRHLSGTCASGLWEARLARKHYSGQLTTFSPAYKAEEMEEIAQASDHVIFNTPTQIARFGAVAQKHGAEIGLRINPQLQIGAIEKYDPCAPGSRLGWPLDALSDIDFSAPHMQAVTGLHFHALCEQGVTPLRHIWEKLESKLQPLAKNLRWLNLGGGHLITHPDYDRDGLVDLLRHIRNVMQCDLHLEPGAAVAFDTGILVGEVLDVMPNDGPNAILDISPTCHMPDVLEAPYRPALMQEVAAQANGIGVRLGGVSCLAGDHIGTYRLPAAPPIGTRLAFLDQAHYSMTRTNTFNGTRLPSLAVWNSDTDALNIVRQFDFEEFERRL